MLMASKKHSSRGKKIEDALEMITEAILGHLEVEGKKKKKAVV